MCCVATSERTAIAQAEAPATSASVETTPPSSDPAGPRSAASRDRMRALERRLEEALQREKVPVVYHEAVRNYFRRLAQLDTPTGP